MHARRRPLYCGSCLAYIRHTGVVTFFPNPLFLAPCRLLFQTSAVTIINFWCRPRTGIRSHPSFDAETTPITCYYSLLSPCITHNYRLIYSFGSYFYHHTSTTSCVFFGDRSLVERLISVSVQLCSSFFLNHSPCPSTAFYSHIPRLALLFWSCRILLGRHYCSLFTPGQYWVPSWQRLAGEICIWIDSVWRSSCYVANPRSNAGSKVFQRYLFD
ncbi:hypothetical protein BDP27DRAFT_98804 [Rhodocollybia butyracea]|uniref:Uncharacterized protein n=1 Tax=Rhodocollybia butyracea TaxID=206335 RepID=A0A9P5UDC3_9AGAR|nr:hypothetical protein BDP27DRAFT_98804 [Rhodocollybia butyracea]